MKNAFWIFLLLLLLGPTLTFAQGKVTPSFTAQKTIVYPVRTSANLAASVAWYTTFFGEKPTLENYQAKHPYAVFKIDSIEVRLDTDPKYIVLKTPLFHWMLPEPDDVRAKRESLREIPGNRATRIQDYGSLSAEQRRRSTDENTDEELVEQVIGFRVYDPAGNQISVINNPIYVPKK